MIAKSVSVFGGHQPGQPVRSPRATVVSAQMPMVGNTVKLVADVYNMTGILTVTLEGSVLGQHWENFPVALAPSSWGAATSAGVKVTHAMVRVRATISSTNGHKAWFDLGIAFTDQLVAVERRRITC